jgi:exopolysaccharide production protein ExoY
MNSHDSQTHPPLLLACPEAAMPRWKRTLDLAGGIAALPFLGVAMCFVWLLMALTSRGPLFFRQERVGYMGRRFVLYKFRTMGAGADTAAHQAHFTDLVRANVPMQKLDANGDHRLIFGGWLLRACGLDELPQIINVLRGEMSLVGPRPCIPYEYEQYSTRQQRRFHSVPGLTGLWQVSGKNRTTFDEMIRLDIRYAECRSLRLDIEILILTLPALIRQLADTRAARRLLGRRQEHTPAAGAPPPTRTFQA